jgi:lysyl-tRNA synthetase class I
MDLPNGLQTVIATWWPWKYYWVSTIKLDQHSPIGRLTRSLKTGVYSDEPLPEQYVTQVFRCDSIGWVKNMEIVYYEAEYNTVEDAKAGHEQTVNALASGNLKLKRARLDLPF